MWVCHFLKGPSCSQKRGLPPLLLLVEDIRGMALLPEVPRTPVLTPSQQETNS